MARKKFMCTILNGYRDTALWIYNYNITNGKKERQITYCYFYFNFRL